MSVSFLFDPVRLVEPLPISQLLATLSCLSGSLANGSEQGLGDSTLLHPSDRAGCLRTSAGLCIVINAQDDDARLRDYPTQGCGSLDAIHLRHLDIHQHHVG